MDKQLDWIKKRALSELDDNNERSLSHWFYWNLDPSYARTIVEEAVKNCHEIAHPAGKLVTHDEVAHYYYRTRIAR